MSYIPIHTYVTTDPRIMKLTGATRYAAIFMLSDVISFFYGGLKNKKKPGVLRKGQKTMMQDYALTNTKQVRAGLKALIEMNAITVLQDGKPGNGQTYHIMYKKAWLSITKTEEFNRAPEAHLIGPQRPMILHNNIKEEFVNTPSSSTEINDVISIRQYEQYCKYQESKNMGTIPMKHFLQNSVQIMNKIKNYTIKENE
jgi:hypothetical protein